MKTPDTSRADRLARRAILALEPRSTDELHRFIQRLLCMDVPRDPLMPGSTAPFDYLVEAFFHDRADNAAGDLLVWASRGSGKTILGAAATLLDLLYKPGIQVRILGGSLEQSSRMFAYLRQFFHHPLLAAALRGRPTRRRLRTWRDSGVEVLAQSHTSVRGTHPHKLRCDEVELFGRDVWQAAQLVPRGGKVGDLHLRGGIEALSTMHHAAGLMADLADRARAGHGMRLMKWCTLDVAAQCPDARPCEGCPLNADCGGRARHAAGFMPIDQIIDERKRCDENTWASEKMCYRPSREGLVYDGFDPTTGGRHVRIFRPPWRDVELLAGMDFGIRSPCVTLFAVVVKADNPAARRVHIVGEHITRDRTLDAHLDGADRLRRKRRWPHVSWVGVDPSGAARSMQTGLSDIAIVRRRGLPVRHARNTIDQGIRLIRRKLEDGTLTIDPRCRDAVRAMACYHFDYEDKTNELPVKDGPDHCCDALRYLVVNIERSHAVEVRRY